VSGTVGAPLPDAAWAITQLVPSPEIAVGGEERGAHVGLRWQVTPVLYSFGVNRRKSPWRAFIAEPMVRQGGSVEAYVSPEWIDEGRRVVDRFALRPGLRIYFPLVQHGDNLSWSMGTSYTTFGPHGGVGYELGVYTLYGIFGLQVTVSPTREEPPCIVTLRVRYF